MKKCFRYAVLLVVLLFLSVASGCGDSPGKVDENIRTAKIKTQKYTKDNTTVFLPVISGMKDESLQKKINQNLKEAILGFEKKGSGSGMEGEFLVMFMNDRLLVIRFDGWNFLKDENDNTTIKKGLHIDLTNGKIYDPSEIFKGKYEDKLLSIAKDNSNYRLFDPSNENWQYGLFKAQWEDKKKGNQFMILTEDFLWAYTFSVAEEGLIPGYGIPYSELEDIINTDSNLWKAFTDSDSRAADFEDLYDSGVEYEEDADERAAREAANEQMKQMDADEAARKAADKKAAADKQAAYDKGKADAQKAAAQKSAAPKAAAQKAKAPDKKSSITWKTTKVVKDNQGRMVVHGMYINNTNKTMLRTNWCEVSFVYRTKSGAQKTYTAKYNAPIEKNIPPGKSATAWFRFNTPSDYGGKYIKVTNRFNYSYK